MEANSGEGYVVIARKWRPSTFEEVIGQEHVTRTLGNAIRSDRVAHAYLFTGPRGVGKTTVARVLAKALNCVEGPTLKPCGKCAACEEIAQGTSMDVIEIDGASNRGIDEIRNLRESVRYASVGGKKKVYIIDEVHMLTQEAFNALLKTLEEPPPHVVFVFATTQPLKVPQTIVSRCQRFDFRRIPADLIASRLKKICDTEGYTCDGSALALISQRAEGSMRDAQSMLEQILAFSGGKATEQDMKPIMGLRGSETVSAIAGAVIRGEEAEVLRLLGEAFDAGIDPLDLVSALTEWLRYLLVFSIDAEAAEIKTLTDTTRKEIEKQTTDVSSQQLLTLLSMIADSEDRIKRASHQRYLLESVVLRMANVETIAKVSDIVDMLRKKQGGPTQADPADKPARKRSGSQAKADRPRRRPPQEAAGYSPEAERPEPVGYPAIGVTADIASSWQDVIDRLRETKASLASILDLCEPPKLLEGVCWLQLPTAFYESQVLKRQNLRILTEEVQKLTNSSVKLKTKVAAGEVQKEPTERDLASVVDNDPVIRALVENLGGRVVGIRRRKTES
jgi:DNA polymerase-3 subunit gamma/tau